MAMTIRELLALQDEMQRANREKVEQWIREGRTDVSPAEAAPILGSKNPYSLNIGAKEHPQPGLYWRGCHLRISINYLLNFMEARYEHV